MFSRGFVYVNFTIIIIMLFTATEINAKEAIIETERLNVRNGPGLHYDVIGQVYLNETYSIILTENNWANVEWNDQSGWITNDYITIVESEQKEKTFTPYSNSEESKKKIEYETHIRSGPSIEKPISKFAKIADEVKIMEENDKWFKVDYKNKAGYVFKSLIGKDFEENNLKNKIIVLDVGHGGYDVGAISSNDNYEKDLTLYTAKELKAKLQQLGAHVFLTRENDNYVSLASRSSFINTHNADVAISLHYNSFPEMPEITGVSTYYYDTQHQFLAESIQEEIVEETNANNRSVTREDFQVLRQSMKPAILIELDFISNGTQEELLLTKIYQQRLVAGMINGLNSYFSEIKKNESAQ